MAGEMAKQDVCDCKWRLAYIADLQDEILRLREENAYLSQLLWHSEGSWAEKEEAARIGVLNDEADAGMAEANEAN